MKYVAKKFLTLIITLFIVSLLAFLAFQVIPGDPTTKMLGTEATPEAVAALRAELGLDKPVPVRYWNWLTAFLTGDMGTSYSYHMPVGEMLSEKLTITAILTILSFAFYRDSVHPAGHSGGQRSAASPWTGSSRLRSGGDEYPLLLHRHPGLFPVRHRIPAFYPGQFCLLYSGLGRLYCLSLFPALSIAIPRIAMTVKMLRGAILNELGQDYVRTAQSRGNSRRAILQRHVLQNALIPVITFLAVSAAEIMTGSIIIEQVFTIPGVGRLLLASISNRDFPVVQAIVVILAAWIVVVNFVADLLYQLVDPRIRLR
jgi:ABC-type dipeptide/oligopeptide/nickel transport system permease component